MQELLALTSIRSFGLWRKLFPSSPHRLVELVFQKLPGRQRRPVLPYPLSADSLSCCAFKRIQYLDTGEPRSELVVSSQSLFLTTLMALRMTAFFGITGP
jgi:hypothetical protein